MTEKIDWRIFLGDVGMLAAQEAMKDPDFRKEVEPVRRIMNETIALCRQQEDEIFRKYKQKYFDQITAEKETQNNLMKAALDRIQAKHESL